MSDPTNTTETAPPSAVPSSRQSAIERLRTSFEQEQAEKSRDFPVPGWRGLWITCRGLGDHVENTDRIGPAASRPGLKTSQREVEVSDAGIVLACETSYIVNPDGTRVDLGAPLGVELAQVLLGDTPPEHAPRTDIQALSMLIPQSSRRVALFERIMSWSNGVADVSEDDLAGK